MGSENRSDTLGCVVSVEGGSQLYVSILFVSVPFSGAVSQILPRIFFLKVLQCSGGRLQTDTFSLLAAFKFRY